MAFKISTFSLDCLSDMVHINLYPFLIHASASPIPVFPEVASIIVPPLFIKPWDSASSIIFKAILSLVECPGLKLSTLANNSASVSIILLILTSGVLPIVSTILLKYSINYVITQS